MLRLSDCGMILVISAIVTASEWEEPTLGLLDERTGNDDEVVGRIVRAGGLGFLDDDEWRCSRWRKLGRLGMVFVGAGDSSDS